VIEIVLLLLLVAWRVMLHEEEVNPGIFSALIDGGHLEVQKMLVYRCFRVQEVR
jgi:hypothetical protein